MKEKEDIIEFMPAGGRLLARRSEMRRRAKGKELDMMNGLNLYDYEFRRHDPSTGRFLTIDPLAEKYPWISP
jgi:RHS repeat-associated protein